jgi:hypothetical protein
MKNLRFVGSFSCPHCHIDLRIPRFYGFVFGMLSLAVSFAIVSEFGLDDVGLVIGGLVGWLPVACVVSIIAIRFFPPEPVAPDEKLIQ